MILAKQRDVLEQLMDRLARGGIASLELTRTMLPSLSRATMSTKPGVPWMFGRCSSVSSAHSPGSTPPVETRGNANFVFGC